MVNLANALKLIGVTKPPTPSPLLGLGWCGRLNLPPHMASAAHNMGWYSYPNQGAPTPAHRCAKPNYLIWQ